MKKIQYFVILFLLNSLCSYGQEVPQKQKMLITKITATWCPNCGTSAWDNKKDLIDQYADEAIFLSTHISSSSDLFSATAREYASNLPNVIGQPLFYINRNKHSNSSIINAAADMKQTIQDQRPLANTGLQMELDGQKLTVQAKTQFFEAANGEYYLSLYIVEDNITAYQANRGNSASHSKILRNRVTPETFGELLVNGPVEADQTFTLRMSKALSPNWNADNLEIVAVIWEKRGEDYEFVNTHSIKEYSTFTAVNILEKQGVALAVTPTTLQTQATVQVTLPTAQKGLSLQLLNTNGQVIEQVFAGDLVSGTHQFSFDKPANLTNGMYLIQLEKGGHSITQKIVVY